MTTTKNDVLHEAGIMQNGKDDIHPQYETNIPLPLNYGDRTQFQHFLRYSRFVAYGTREDHLIHVLQTSSTSL